jgi:DNA repair exonuclease SbcCD ATPase subunit
MKKTILRRSYMSGIVNGVRNLAFVALGVSFITSCSSGPSKEELTAKVDSLSIELSKSNKQVDDFMGVFNEVSEGFRQINEAENRISVQGGEIAGAPESAKDKLRSDLLFIQNRMKENRELIADLQNKLKNSNYKSSQLKKAVDTLTAELAAKANEIKALQEELAAKNIRVKELDEAVASLTNIKDELTAQNADNQKTISQQDKALNAAWYVVGSKKQLKEQKILTNTGLFKKGDVMEDANVNKEGFTQVDIRNTNEIVLGTKKAKVLTTHPEGSYSIVKNEEGVYTLKIEDAAMFWSVTRYLVVRTN